MGGLQGTIGAKTGRVVTTAGPRQRIPPWKTALAFVSLALSLLLWVNGLVASLTRPSVGNDLGRRQLELAALAAPQLPPSWRAAVVGQEPEASLLAELQRQAQLPPLPDSAENDQDPEFARVQQRSTLLTRALLLIRAGTPEEARPLLERLDDGTDPGQSALIRSLLAGSPRTGVDPVAAALPLENPLQRRLTCQALGGSADRCALPAEERRAKAQLLAANALPALALLVGLALLVRAAWVRVRTKPSPLPPLVGPELGAVDLILLISGGFVLLGEVLTPVLVSPVLKQLLDGLQVEPSLAKGLTVVALYLGLIAAPLAILLLMLPKAGPEGGWLQFRWRPLAPTLGRSFQYFLMVLPLVSFAGWLQQQIWPDPGGSNPLLEMVLNNRSSLGLLCFAFTAVVLAPLFEEVIFRGVLLPVVARDLGPSWGVVISATIFAVAHLSLGELPALFVLGLALGWLRLNSGRLSASVWLHSLWNSFTFTNLLLLGS